MIFQSCQCLTAEVNPATPPQASTSAYLPKVPGYPPKGHRQSSGPWGGLCGWKVRGNNGGGWQGSKSGSISRMLKAHLLISLG